VYIESAVPPYRHAGLPGRCPWLSLPVRVDREMLLVLATWQHHAAKEPIMSTVWGS
jgi:hypothetical protein